MSNLFVYSDVAIQFFGRTWCRLKPGMVYKANPYVLASTVYPSMDYARKHWKTMFDDEGFSKHIREMMREYPKYPFDKRVFKKPLSFFVLLEIERMKVPGPFLFAARVVTEDGETGVVHLTQYDKIKRVNY